MPSVILKQAYELYLCVELYTSKQTVVTIQITLIYFLMKLIGQPQYETLKTLQ